MGRTVKVTYDSSALKTTIIIDDDCLFDTSRIDGKEIADWAYPFSVRKVQWNGFYDEMVEALDGEKEFNLIFEGSESDLNELREAWEDAPVTVISEDNSENIVIVSYDENSLTTEITVNGNAFDTSRIDGKEIADWAYPFSVRKVQWNGFYDEMVEALGGAKEFSLIFKGSEAALNELAEAWENAPVTVIAEDSIQDIVAIVSYDENSLKTEITVNGNSFDTSRINGKEIYDWAYPFSMRRAKWNGIFSELAEFAGTDTYTIEFSGSDSAFNELMTECPDTVKIVKSEPKPQSAPKYVMSLPEQFVPETVNLPVQPESEPVAPLVQSEPEPEPVASPVPPEPVTVPNNTPESEDTHPSVTLDDILLEAFSANLSQYTSFEFYFPKDIKFQTKLKNAKTKYAFMDSTEQVIFLFDHTVFGSAKDGFVVTTKKFHYHEMGDRLTVPIEDITDVVASGSDNISLKYIMYGIETTYSISMGLKSGFNKTVAGLMKKIFDLIKLYED